MACLTGVGASLFTADATIKFTSANWNIRSISGGGRSVPVIDDSHLGIAAGRSKQYCFGVLAALEPFTVDCHLNTDNTTLFATITDTGTQVHDNPVQLGAVVSTGEPADFTLTLPTNGTAGTLVFSGAIVRDSGYAFTEDDRPRMTLTIQPDGKDMDWTEPS